MGEIEKMYKNAGILKECLSPCYINKTWRKTHDCPNCDNRGDYPPFTADKQLWLIKWLSDKDEYVDIHYDRYKGLFEMQTGSGGLCVCNDFENALALRVNMIWQDLKPEEKQQVKGILE